MEHTADLTTRELADLSALADGTLDPERRDSVQAWVDSSPERTALYEREQRAVALLRTTHSDGAPAALRARIEAQRTQRRAPVPRWRLAYGGAVAAGLAVIALALALILPAGTPGAPSFSEAAALASLGANAPAPTPDPSEPGAKLGQKVGSVYFPDWTQRYGWRATGQRTDRIGGRLAETVYYQGHNDTVAYTIVAAPALKVPSATHSRLNGTDLATLKLDGRTVVTWQRNGHTCVLTAKHGTPARVLQQLAASPD
jgi:anti-sigma factor RsiW